MHSTGTLWTLTILYWECFLQHILFSCSHIWTYIHSQNENSFFEWQDGRSEIFCAGKSVGKSPPSFISNDCFCESGSKYNNSSTRTLVWEILYSRYSIEWTSCNVVKLKCNAASSSYIYNLASQRLKPMQVPEARYATGKFLSY